MDKRYPIGTFDFEGEVNLTQRNEWIKEIEEMPKKLILAVKDLTEEQIDLTYREGGWSLRQVVHHIADSHMNSYIRFKLALTEETPTVKTYSEALWAELEDAVVLDINISISLLEALHKRWVVLLKSMGESDFKRAFYHPDSQKMITLEYCLGLYVWHGNHHIAQITMLRNTLNV